MPRNTITIVPAPSSQITAICRLRREHDDLKYLEFVNEAIKHIFAMHIQIVHDKMAEEYTAVWVAKQEIRTKTEPVSDRTARPVTPTPKRKVVEIEPKISPKSPSRIKPEELMTM